MFTSQVFLREKKSCCSYIFKRTFVSSPSSQNESVFEDKKLFPVTKKKKPRANGLNYDTQRQNSQRKMNISSNTK